MDYDEKMKLLVALKDNPNESRAIIDTFPFSQSTFRRTHARSAIWCRLVHLKMIGVKCQPTDKDVEGIDTTASSVTTEKKVKKVHASLQIVNHYINFCNKTRDKLTSKLNIHP